jgi:ribosomal protein S18 acetylase RimI-like enzyme
MNEPRLTPLDYETRNLGLRSFAVRALPADRHQGEELAALMSEEATQHGSIFVQAKCAINELNCLHLLEEIGFHFVETALVPTCNINKNKELSEFCINPASVLPGRFSVDEITVSVMEVDALIDSVRSIAAESFTRDRFHLDPHCDNTAANRRYSNWVDDLLADSTVTFHLLHHREEIAGFMARRGEHLVLAGFSRRHIGSGFGDFLWLSVLKAMQDEGLRQVHTQISASNTAVHNLYVRLGFKFRDPFFLLHYWSGRPVDI